MSHTTIKMSGIEKVRSKVRKMISGCLRTAIHVHGPITKETISSAAKRVAHQVLASYPSIVHDVKASGESLSTLQGGDDEVDSIEDIIKLLSGAKDLGNGLCLYKTSLFSWRELAIKLANLTLKRET